MQKVPACDQKQSIAAASVAFIGGKLITIIIINFTMWPSISKRKNQTQNHHLTWIELNRKCTLWPLTDLPPSTSPPSAWHAKIDFANIEMKRMWKFRQFYISFYCWSPFSQSVLLCAVYLLLGVDMYLVAGDNSWHVVAHKLAFRAQINKYSTNWMKITYIRWNIILLDGIVITKMDIDMGMD